MSAGELFLTSEQLEELTGYRQAAAQIRWLRRNGVTHYVRADGRPVVVRDESKDKTDSEEFASRQRLANHLARAAIRKSISRLERAEISAKRGPIEILKPRKLPSGHVPMREMTLLKDSATYARARKAAVKRATPSWADISLIDAVYDEARRLTLKTGIDHHVDHEIPINGRTVSGLHVHYNLRAIPAHDNLRRPRIFTPE